MWLESEVVFRELVPDGIEFIHLTRIRPHEVLKNTRRSNRHLIVLDSSVFVVHSFTQWVLHNRRKMRRPKGAELALRFQILERKDRRKLRPDVVSREARDAAKERQRSGANIRARPVITLLADKSPPLVPLVLNVTREEIATIAARTKPSRVTRSYFIITIVEISTPTSVTPFRIRVEYSR